VDVYDGFGKIAARAETAAARTLQTKRANETGDHFVTNLSLVSEFFDIRKNLSELAGDRVRRGLPPLSSCNPAGGISRVIHPIGEQEGAGDDNVGPSRPQAVQHGGRQRS
jgi:hypothetical protein